MTKVICANGVVLQFDEMIKIGDIITCYYSGYHKVVEIIPRDSNTPLMEFKLIMTASGKKKQNQKPRSCDASYCRLASESIPDIIKEHEDIICALKQFQGEYL